jgi:hypothetical protein
MGAVSSVTNVIEKAVDQVSTVIDNTAKSIEKDPVGAIAKITTAIVAPAYLPAVVVADAVGQGAPLDKALVQGAKSYVAGQIGNAVSQELNAPVGSVNGPDNIDVGGGFNPATPAGTGDAITASAATAPLSTTKGNATSQAPDNIDIGGGSNFANSAGAGDAATAAAAAPLTSRAIAGAAGSTASNIVMGQDPVTALVNGGIQAGVATIAPQIPGYDQLSPAQQKAVNIVVASALSKGDPSQALVNAAINAGINEARAQFKAPQAMQENISTPTPAPLSNTPAASMGSIGAIPTAPEPMSSTSSTASEAPPVASPLSSVEVTPKTETTAPLSQDVVPVTDKTTADITTPVVEEAAPVAEKPATEIIPPLSTTDYTVKPDYSLTPTAPASPLGLTATPDTSETIASDGTVNYELTPTAPLGVDTTTGTGLQPSETPNINYMNGAQGLTAPVQGGTASALGVTPDNASPNLGDPKSIINNPSVLGTPVAQTDTSPIDTSIKLPNINLPTSSAVKKAIAASAFSNAAGSIPTGANAPTPSTLSQQVLDSSPQYLGYTLKDQALTPEGLKKLHQLYGSLDPALAKEFAIRGIVPPTDVASNNPFNLEDYQTKLYAEGGEVMPSFSTGGTNSQNSGLFDSSVFNPVIKPVSPNMLPPAPVSATPLASRLGALKYLYNGLGGKSTGLSGLASGGLPTKYAQATPKGHKPEFITGLTGYYAEGKGTGQSDDIPAMLHDGDYVADADLVAALGDGSSKAGAEALEKFRRQIPHQKTVDGEPVPAKIADGEYVFPASFVTAIGKGDNKAGAKLLDSMREAIRAHKRSAPTSKIPPKAKSPLDYLKMAKG